jgi:hypothetical protein
MDEDRVRLLPHGVLVENIPPRADIPWPARIAAASVAETLGGHVGVELALEPGDLVLEQELAALQALQLELVVDELVAEPLDDVVEIAVLDLELQDALLKHRALDLVHGGCPRPFGSF